jgi:hypothetical protein
MGSYYALVLIRVPVVCPLELITADVDTVEEEAVLWVARFASNRWA